MYISGVKSNYTTLYRWWVPVSFTRAGGDFSDTSNRAFIPPHDGSISINAGPGAAPLVVNVLEANYYRVNYGDAHWRALADAIKADADSVHKINRAQLMDDALNLAKAGYLSYETALGGHPYMTSALREGG